MKTTFAPYRFQTSEFIFENNTIRLRRNEYVYHEIPLREVAEIKICKGKLLKRWVITLCLGVALLVFVVYDLIRIAQIMLNPEGFTIYMERLLIPLFPAIIGAYSVVIAMRKTQVLHVRAGDKIHYLELHELIKHGEYDDFVKTLVASFPALLVYE